MARILGVNGIHNWSWSKSSFTDKLLDTLGHQHEVVDVQYPRMWAFLAYSDAAIKRRAKKILEANRPGDILIAHSFGCLASIYAMRMGARFNKVFFFAAAADDFIEIPDAFSVAYNIHSDSDTALTFGGLMPWHAFGGMGKTGYAGVNRSVINVLAPDHDHNDYVHPANICRWSTAINDVISGRITSLPEIKSMIQKISRKQNPLQPGQY